jgi:DNA processing protein
VETPLYVPFDAFSALRPERQVPPVFGGLWCLGQLQGLARPTVAVVGTRAASPYGKSIARRFASDLSAAGCCVISGLALGIDGAAHEGALERAAPTIGVLGGGHRRFFPPRHRGLAQRILEYGGAVLSPYPPEHDARPGQFLERNGIVAALSDAVVVIEAPARSGALNTAGWAAGRIPVFAVPGDIERLHVAGCHALIRDGAILARSADDVLADLRLPAAPHIAGELPPSGDHLQDRIAESLRAGEASLDALVERVGEPAPRILAALSLMELRAAIEVRAGARYALR